MRGHEFHYSRISPSGRKRGVRLNVFGEPRERATLSSASFRNTLATYTHVHFGSNGKSAGRFVNFIREGARWK
jgi:cobyrinic acid a,c-diamide synthase